MHEQCNSAQLRSSGDKVAFSELGREERQGTARIGEHELHQHQS